MEQECQGCIDKDKPTIYSRFRFCPVCHKDKVSGYSIERVGNRIISIHKCVCGYVYDWRKMEGEKPAYVWEKRVVE